LCREITALSFEIHTKSINALYRKHVEFWSVKPGGIYSNHWALKGYRRRFRSLNTKVLFQ